MTYIYLKSAKFDDLMRCGSKDIFQMHPVPCTNTHHDVTDFIKYGMVKNKKTLNILRTEHNFSTK